MCPSLPPPPTNSGSPLPVEWSVNEPLLSGLHPDHVGSINAALHHHDGRDTAINLALILSLPASSKEATLAILMV